MGLRTQTQNAAFFERKGPERKPWPRGKSLNRKKRSQCVFLNALRFRTQVPESQPLLGLPSGNLLPKTRVLKHRVLERKRRRSANASVLGTQRFRTLSVTGNVLRKFGGCQMGGFQKVRCKLMVPFCEAAKRDSVKERHLASIGATDVALQGAVFHPKHTKFHIF